ncbi:oligosaccharide flippase family protein [Escherichia coli]|uniref:oligosaccharide flippase family protein n=1 Tax=Escherichia coli TaxID=562 RepID=UPI000CFC7711|nr:oligosaccharide flippase family protein [Escherichia coli]
MYSNNLKKLVTHPVLLNIYWLMSEKILTVGLIFYAEGLIAKLLTKYQYGEWIYSLNLVTLISSLALIVGAEVAVPALSRNKSLTDEIITSLFKIRFFFALIAFLALNVYCVIFVEPSLLKKFIMMLSVIIILNEPFSVVINYYQSITKIKSIALLRLFSLACRTFFIWLCYCLTLQANLLALSRVIELFVLAISLIFLWKYKKFRWKVKPGITKFLFIRGASLWPSLVLMYLYLRMDRFFVEHYLSFEVLAVYGIAVQLTEQTFVLVKMIIQSAAPRYVYARMNHANLLRNIKKLILFNVIICSSISVLCFFVLPLIVTSLFGENYQRAASLAINMLPALFFYSIDSVIMQYLYREKKSILILFKWGAGTILMFVSYYMYFDFFEMKVLSIIYNLNYFCMMLLTITVFLWGRQYDK